MKNVKERTRPDNFESIKTNFSYSQPMIFPNMQKYVVMIFREQMSLWWCAIINNTNLSCKIAEKNNIILGLSLTKTSKMRNNNIWNRPIH